MVSRSRRLWDRQSAEALITHFLGSERTVDSLPCQRSAAALGDGQLGISEAALEEQAKKEQLGTTAPT
jgi:hypothetical protein